MGFCCGRAFKTTMNFKNYRLVALFVWPLVAMSYVAAQVSSPATTSTSATATESRSINDWLMRMHEAS